MSDPDTPADALGRLGLAVGAAPAGLDGSEDEWAPLLEELEQLLAGDVSATGGAVLLALRDGPATPTELSERLGVARATASHAAKSLVQEGMVEGRRNLSDARSVVYSLRHGRVDGGAVTDSDGRRHQ